MDPQHEIDPAEYLARIGHRGGLRPTAASLAALQEAHLLSVPFENLDIARGVPILLDPDALRRKVVRARRGGFCYELNGLFHLLLLSLGFRSTMVSARVFDAGRGGYGPEFDHLALLVEADGTRFLADVGFGDFSKHPLPIAPGEVLDDPAGTFRFHPVARTRMIVTRRRSDGPGFDPQYDFSFEPRRLSDFEGMSRHHQTSPDSHFTRQSVCTMATPSGRITLTPERLIETAGASRTLTPMRSDVEYRETLRLRFGIDLRP